MGYDGSLKFDTEIDEKGFNSGITKLGGLAKGGLTVLAGAVAGVATAMGAGVAAGVKYNASIEQYQTSFEVMTGSADKAADVIERLKKVGAQTPFELPDLADTTQLLMNYGFTADDAMNSMMMLGDISQGSADKMSRIATAYGQMSSAGKVQLEDIKQMIEAGFNPLQEISESTGESMDSLYDRISKGTLSVDEITASMERATSEGGKYYKSMEKQSQTVTGMISTLKDNAQQLLGDVVKPITESIASELLPSAIGAIEQLTSAFKTKGVEGLIDAGGQIIANLIAGISQKAPDVINIAASIIQSLLTGIQFNAPAIANGAAQILSAFAQGILTLLPQIAVVGIQLIVSLVNGIAQQLPTLIPKAVECVMSLANGLIDNADSIFDAGISLIDSLAEGIVNSIPVILSKAPIIIVKLTAAIISNLPQILSVGIRILTTLAGGLVQAVPQLIGKIPSIVSQIKSAFSNVEWGSVGSNIISGITSGIAGAAGKVVDAAVNAAKNALEFVKSKLGIHSPSTVFRDQVGKYMALGMGVGFEENIPTQEMGRSIEDSVGTMSKKVGTVTKSAASTVREQITSSKSNNTDDNNPTVLNITNVFEVDGEKLEEKTTKRVIKKIGKDVTKSMDFKGGRR